MSDGIHDVIVIGAGVGGLVSAGLLARSGRDVLLLESHDKPGGTAGYYEKNGFVLDAGATTLIGLEEDGPLARILGVLGIDPAEDLGASVTDGVEIEIGGESFFLGRDEHTFRSEVDRSFPAARPFFDRSSRDAAALWDLTRRWPVLPIRRVSDVVRNARTLHPALLRLLPTFGKTVEDVRRQMAAPETGAFRKALDLSLLITVQNTSEGAPWWNGALGINLFRRGVYRARGGMRTFVHALLDSALGHGARVHFRTLVTRMRREGGLWHVRTARGETIRSRSLVSNLPLETMAPLVRDEAEGISAPAASRDGWGALVLNLGLSRPLVDDPRRLHFLWLQDPGRPFGDANSLFLSFSPPGDPAAPPGGQTLSISSHTAPGAWFGSRTAYLERKKEMRERILAPVRKRWPHIDSLVSHEDLGTPRTFRRFVRRSRVGGLQTALANSGFFAPDPTLGLPAFQHVGDTTFPGAGTLASAMSAVYAAERLGAVTLTGDGSIRFCSRKRRE